MKRDHARSWFEQSLAELAKARRHLDYSFQQVAGLPDTLAGATEKQLESAEAFTGRFARSVDLLVNKVLRALDRMELKTEGTLLDVVNRAEKRGFVNQSEELREMKDVRNLIAAPPRRCMEFVVYAIKSSAAERLYVGQTADISARLGQHNSGRVKSTKAGRTWFLVSVETFPNRSLARLRERELKCSRGARIRWLANHKII